MNKELKITAIEKLADIIEMFEKDQIKAFNITYIDNKNLPHSVKICDFTDATCLLGGMQLELTRTCLDITAAAGYSEGTP